MDTRRYLQFEEKCKKQKQEVTYTKMKTHLKEKLHNKHSWGKKSCHTITTITTKDTPKIITVVYSC